MPRVGRTFPAKAIFRHSAPPPPVVTNQALDATSTFTAALVTALSFQKVLAVTSTFVAAMTERVLYKITLAVSAAWTVALTRQVKYFIAFAVSSPFGVVLQKLILKNLAVSSTFTPALSKKMFKEFAIASVFNVVVNTSYRTVRTLAATTTAATNLVAQFISGSAPVIQQGVFRLKRMGGMFKKRRHQS